MRLQKFISMAGVTSRRKAEEIILKGKVKVNGKIVKELGTKVDPNKDIVTIDGKRINIADKNVYIMLYKPEGYVTTLWDEFNRPKVIDLIKGIDERIYPVGRLDYNTSGLLLLTNDGELANKITHPKNQLKKTYIALVKGIPKGQDIIKFEKGLDIGGYITAPAKLEILKKYKDFSKVKIVIHEGKNRQIRKMMEKLGYPVIKLERIKIGELNLKGLKKGEWRYLTDDEIAYLKNL